MEQNNPLFIYFHATDATLPWVNKIGTIMQVIER